MRTTWSVLVALCGACYDPSFQVGLPCSPSGDCPSGQICAADRTCQLSTSANDGAPPGDGGGTPDAMQVPLESWFLSFQHPGVARANDVGAVPGGFALVGSSVVIVVDPRGELRWQRELELQLAAVAGVPGGMVVGGTSYPDAAVARLDQDGELVWQKVYRDQDQSSVQAVVAIPGTDQVVVIGQSYDAADLGSTWLFRLDAGGAIVWQQRFTLADGTYVTGGTATDDGGVVVAGTIDGETLEERDLIAFKVDADGGLRWQKRVSAGDNEWGTSAARGLNGEIWVIGGTWANSFGAADVWVLRMDESNGAIEAQHRIGTGAQDSGIDVYPYAATGALMVGATSEDGNSDLLVLETKEDALTTQYRIGTGEGDYAAAAAFTRDGAVVFGDTGAFGENIGFFAAGMPMPEGLDGPCPHDAVAGADMATHNATATDTDLTETTTTTTPTDLAGAATRPDISNTTECE